MAFVVCCTGVILGVAAGFHPPSMLAIIAPHAGKGAAQCVVRHKLGVQQGHPGGGGYCAPLSQPGLDGGALVALPVCRHHRLYQKHLIITYSGSSHATASTERLQFARMLTRHLQLQSLFMSAT